MQLTIKVWGDDYVIDCRYRCGSPGTYYDPPEPAVIDINEVVHKATGTNVTFLLDSGVRDVFYDEAYAQLDAAVSEEAACYADYEFDRRRDERFFETTS